MPIVAPLIFFFPGDGTCEGVACHYNADCVALDNSDEPEKECRCKPGYTGRGVICSGELNGISFGNLTGNVA